MSPLSIMASQTCAACSAAATVAAVSTGVWPTSAVEHSTARNEATNGIRSDRTLMKALAVKDSSRKPVERGCDGQCSEKRRNSRDHRPADQGEERRTWAACCGEQPMNVRREREAERSKRDRPGCTQR